MATQNSILVIVTGHDRLPNQHKTGLWFEEYAIPARLFRQHDFSVTVASLSGGATPIDPASLHGQSDDREALTALENTHKLNELKLADFDAVFFPGGHGAMFDLADSAEIGSAVAEFLQSGRIVGAVCHGPAALVAAKYPDGTAVVKNRKLTGFSNKEEQAAQLDSQMPFLLQDRLEELGAQVITADNWQDHTITDGNLITGQNPQSSASTAMAFIHAIHKQLIN